MNTNGLGGKNRREQVVLALLFLGIASLIMIVFSPWRPLLDSAEDYLGRIALVAFLAIITLLIKRSDKYNQHVQIFYGLMILAIAVSLDYIFGVYLGRVVGVTDLTPFEWALQKFNEFLIIVTVVVFMSRVTGSSLGDLYIQKGKLSLGLTIGLITFILAVVGSIPMATLFEAKDLTIARAIPWLPWVLVFVLCNAAMEEIMFRGLFLKKLESYYGKLGANLMVAVVFTLLHGAVTYSADNYIFLAILFPLALAWGYIMQKTEGVWGSILFHAGMDIPIILGIFSNL